MAYVDPTTIRLSDTLLLSDAMGCDSVYRYGYANKIRWPEDKDKINEGKLLASLLDQLHEEYGPYSVAYGYVSPDLSKKIVKYQDPDKPSYHRWDYGAAMDVCFHEWTDAPIYLAHKIDDDYEYSRMITYSESPWICVGTRVSEHEGKSRRAFYENRYVGERKPHRVTYSNNEATREAAKENHVLEHNWVGQGYPSYHGGGSRQMQHHRIGRYLVLTDVLYHSRSVHDGKCVAPPKLATHAGTIDYWEQVSDIAAVVDAVVSRYKSRMSIVRTGLRIADESFVSMVPPSFLDVEDVAHFVHDNITTSVRVEKVKTGENRVRVDI